MRESDIARRDARLVQLLFQAVEGQARVLLLIPEGNLSAGEHHLLRGHQRHGRLSRFRLLALHRGETQARSRSRAQPRRLTQAATALPGARCVCT